MLLTSFVYYKVPGTKLVAVKVLDGDKVVWSDPLLHPPVLPHHISRGLCGYNLHCNPAPTHTDHNIHAVIGHRFAHVDLVFVWSEEGLIEGFEAQM